MIDRNDIDAILVAMDQRAFAAGVDRHAREAILALSAAGAKHSDTDVMADARTRMSTAIIEAESETGR